MGDSGHSNESLWDKFVSLVSGVHIRIRSTWGIYSNGWQAAFDWNDGVVDFYLSHSNEPCNSFECISHLHLIRMRPGDMRWDFSNLIRMQKVHIWINWYKMQRQWVNGLFESAPHVVLTDPFPLLIVMISLVLPISEDERLVLHKCIVLTYSASTCIRPSRYIPLVCVPSPLNVYVFDMRVPSPLNVLVLAIVLH